MPYFETRDIVAIIVCAALWTALNSTTTPVFFAATHLPLLCNFLAFVSLIIIFAGLHAVGGFIGGIIGLILIGALKARNSTPKGLQ